MKRCLKMVVWCSRMRIVFIVICAIFAGVASYFGHSLMRDNADAVIVITTVMTVFAGFLVAIMTILGDPVMIPKGSWRIAENRHRDLENTIIRHMYLFYLYLIAVGLMFASVLLQKLPHGKMPELIGDGIEFGCLFFGIWSFLLTLSLPKAIGKIQLARSEAEIEARRVSEGIRPASDL